MMTERQYHQQFDRLMKRIENLYTRKYSSFFKKVFNFAASIVAGGDVREAEKSIKRFDSELKQLLASNYNSAAGTFGVFVSGMFGDEKSILPEEKKEKLSQTFLDAMDRWISTQTAQKVAKINSTTRDMIRRIVENGLNEGSSNSMIAGDLREAGKFSRWRSSLIATTETHNASTYAAKTMVSEYKFPKQKKWMNAGDERVRADHRNVTTEWIDENEKFDVGGEQLDIPGDSAGSARNVCRCRCAVMYRRKPDEVSRVFHM